jgi:hypothetical protein
MKVWQLIILKLNANYNSINAHELMILIFGFHWSTNEILKFMTPVACIINCPANFQAILLAHLDSAQWRIEPSTRPLPKAKPMRLYAIKCVCRQLYSQAVTLALCRLSNFPQSTAIFHCALYINGPSGRLVR